MILYQKLFGRILLKPLDDEGSAGGAGSGDRGDSYTPETPVKAEGTGDGDDNDENGADDDLKTAMGDKEDQPRDDKGKFAKKEKGEDDEPRIPLAHHIHLVQWALHVGYSLPDAETFNPGKSQAAEAEFARYFGARPDADLRADTRNDETHRIVAW